jgi:hypothetical protein
MHVKRHFGGSAEYVNAVLEAFPAKTKKAQTFLESRSLMANGTEKESPMPHIKGKDFPKLKEFPYIDTLRPGDKGSLVESKGRSVNVSTDAPKEETQSSPSGNINTPDKSGNYSIKDVPPQDR